MINPPSIFTGLPRDHTRSSTPEPRPTAAPDHPPTRDGRNSSLPATKATSAWLAAQPHATDPEPPPGPVNPPSCRKSVADSFVAPSKPAEKRLFPHQGPAHKHPHSEPLHKRRKLQKRSRHTLDCFDLPAPSLDRKQPPSPLFFSHTKRARPPLPARFSSSEAAARMLSNAREDSGIKTVTLARGTYAGSSPSTRTSVDRASLPPASPEIRDRPEVPRALSNIGIGELLEQDGRPTFIVDLGEPTNYGPGYFHVVFANSALRASIGLLDLVSGKVVHGSQDPATFKAFTHFKTWVLSAVVHGESLDVCIPGMLYGGLSWTIYTIRKKYRVVSGNYAASPTPTTTSSLPGSVATQQPSSAGRFARGQKLGPPDSEGLVLPSTESDATDYFGLATGDGPSPDDMPSTPQTAGTMTTAAEPAETPQTPAGLTGRLFGATSDVASFVTHPSLTNECVLRAAVAGTVDPFESCNDPSSRKEIGFFDWTRLPIDSNLPKHIQFARSVDWASTPLGPIEFWSADLRQMCNLIMASPHPAAMYWGEDLVAIYNEAYILLAGQKHPTLMGQSYKDAWAEIWEDVKDVFASAKTTGQATMKDDDCLFIKRSNYLEETYFSWAIIPMIGGDGTVMGLYNPAFEKTRRKIAERRMLTLREVGERTAVARDIKSFWDQVMKALASNEYDTPFVLLYSVADDSDSDSSSMHSSSVFGTKQCLLEGSMGVPAGHQCAPDQLELKTSMDGFAPVLREVMKTDKPVLLDIGSGDLPTEMMEGIGGRGFDDPVRSIVVCPIHPTTGESILGFLVLGVNPRRPYDDDYNLFVQLLSRQLATSLASVVLFEEEIRRGQRAAKLAAMDRMELSEQLAARTQEARDSETRFTRMAEFSPAGLFIANSEGHIIYCNDTWYEISRVHKDTASTDQWIDAVKPEDQQMVAHLWNTLVEKTEAVTAEFRFKAPWEDRNGNSTDTWVLFSAYPEKNVQGTLKSVFGTITNISQQKWAEGFQKRKMEEAVELKRQQENFIDITSHEMRNPLSAILQCADEISSSLLEFRQSGSKVIEEELVSNSIDAAQTIALCAQHQKRIVDDVLTLSKLDSAMLLVTPVDVQPLTVVQRALKMFEGELQTADIQMEFIVDESFNKLGVDWVRLDPSRVLQVLINLTTNAIKFTTTEAKRTIKVTIAASTVKFSKLENRLVNYFPTRSKRVDMTESHDWGTGDDIYVHFAVQDTGRGLNEEEKKLLFLRFSQASPRTHVQYGGSGLGLFISRELTELQGGEIGVSSEAGKGSTFAFYVKARRSSPPADPVEQLPVSLARAPSDPRNKRAQDPIIKTRDFAAPVPSRPTSAASSSQKNNQAQSRKDITVLIVEDNLVNQKVLQKQLKNQGFTVHVANHGGECLDQLRTSTHYAAPLETSAPPLELSVVLMDQEMPVMDGLACTRTIRGWEENGKLIGHVPIIAVTANARAEQIAQLMAAGMDDVVSKPFRIPELVPKIEELAEKFKKREEDKN
ncbi:histidine kinase hhk13p [Diplodia corticola]|uniref:Histidine kinase hhk13p n=1 Tax=Diplodia corticola TaxID=236234 RepID=A0A1J9R412_9PEZI|nr:histidine kinase hhk13p [Diplodia corticola]OJD35344.1 histidine kinase hhk13p [Diplodia corticola]